MAAEFVARFWEAELDSLSGVDSSAGYDFQLGAGQFTSDLAASWHAATVEAGASLQTAQLAVPEPPLLLPSGGAAGGLPQGSADAARDSADRAERRMDYIGSEVGRGDLSGAAGHALLGTPFPAHVDDPQALPMASDLNKTRTATDDGKPISERAMQLRPPGDCEPGRYADLKGKVEETCKIPNFKYSCDASMSQTAIQARIDQNMACGTARDHINSECFAGGNYTHREESAEAWKKVSNCQTFLQ